MGPIEIKLITTQIPDGLPQGEDGDEAQMQGLLFNMMTGNIQGYDDITNQRLSENNYEFSWNQEMMEDLDKTITDLNGEEPDQDQDTEGKVVEKLVSLVPETLDIYDVETNEGDHPQCIPK